MAGTTSDTQLRHLRSEFAAGEIEVGLGLHVVAEDAIRVPLGLVPVEIVAIRVEERAVEAHPAPVDEVVGDRQPRVLSRFLRQILFDSSRADRPVDRIGPRFSIRRRQRHEVATIAHLHGRAYAHVVERVVACEIALHGACPGLLRHPAVVGLRPGREAVLVAPLAVLRRQVVLVHAALAQRLVVGPQRMDDYGDDRRSQHGRNRASNQSGGIPNQRAPLCSSVLAAHCSTFSASSSSR